MGQGANHTSLALWADSEHVGKFTVTSSGSRDDLIPATTWRHAFRYRVGGAYITIHHARRYHPAIRLLESLASHLWAHQRGKAELSEVTKEGLWRAIQATRNLTSLALGPRGPRHPRLLPRTHRRPGRGVTPTGRHTNVGHDENLVGAGMASGFGGWHHTYKKLHT
jgi:hypothetical protein